MNIALPRIQADLHIGSAAPAIVALIVVELPDPEERTRTMGIYTFVSVAGASIGSCSVAS